MRHLLCVLFVGMLFQQSESITVMSVDLGSEWMKIAIVKPGVPMEIVLNKETKRKTEVAVAMKDGERIFGSAAVAQGVRFPKNTYIYMLDLLAKKIDNPLVQRFKERYPYYDLVEDPTTGYVQFRHDEETVYSPEELLAMTLNYSKSLAEEYAQQSVDSSIITVPSYFNQAERTMLLYAANLAGLPSPQIMDVATAAALNYGVFRRNDINATATYIMLYDMGATSTVATIVAYEVVKVNGITDPQLSVKGTGFDRTLGGSEVEFRLREHLVKEFDAKKKTKSDVRKSPKAMAKLLKEARRLKLVLSANAEHNARVESLIDDEDFSTRVSREQLETLCEDLWPRVAKPLHEALSSASLTMDSISKLILVGGGTRVPKVQEILLKESGFPALGKSLNADEAPALGASYEAAVRSKGFRVKTFHVKAGATYPIEVSFDRLTTHDNGTTTSKMIRKTLFQRGNPYPQKKVITFNRFYTDFDFYVGYGDLKYLTEDQLQIFGSKNLTKVSLQGVDIAHETHGTKNDTDTKGVKAHFRMDVNGILNLEEVEAVFERNATNTTVEEEKPATEDEASTLEKLKNSFSHMFTGADDESEKADATGDDKTQKKSSEEESEDKKEENKEEDSKADSKNESEDPKEEEKAETQNESEDGKKDEKPKEETLEKNETKAVNATDEKKKTKKVKISIPLNKTEDRLDFVEHSSETTEKSKERLKVLSERDALKVAREEAMNALEAYIYDKQDKAYQEEYEKAMSPTEAEEIPKALREASDWMFELEEDVAPEVYKEKLSELKKLARPWLLRVRERSDVKPLLAEMEIMFNYTSHFIQAINALSEDDQIYTEVEINVLKKIYNETVTWKNETLKKQEGLESFADNVLKPADLKTKMGALNREIQYLLNKARTTKPKPKKTNSTESANKTKESAVNGTETIEPPEEGTEQESVTPSPTVTDEPTPENEEKETENQTTEKPETNDELKEELKEEL